MIAGYNTANKKDQEKYDAKKLCRVMGCGMAVITVLLLVMAVGMDILPVGFVYIFLIVVLMDCAVIMILSNTICKK